MTVLSIKAALRGGGRMLRRRLGLRNRCVGTKHQERLPGLNSWPWAAKPTSGSNRTEGGSGAKPILELNMRHDLVKALGAARGGAMRRAPARRLLLACQQWP